MLPLWPLEVYLYLFTKQLMRTTKKQQGCKIIIQNKYSTRLSQMEPLVMPKTSNRYFERINFLFTTTLEQFAFAS